MHCFRQLAVVSHTRTTQHHHGIIVVLIHTCWRYWFNDIAAMVLKTNCKHADTFGSFAPDGVSVARLAIPHMFVGFGRSQPHENYGIPEGKFDIAPSVDS